MSLCVRPYQVGDRDAVIALWRQCNLVAAGNDPARDIEIKRQYQPELFFVGTIDDRVVATVMAGYEGHRGWINYLAVSPNQQRCGFGRQMMGHAERALHQLGCPKINLQVRSTNTGVIAFYQALGFDVEDRVSMGKRL